MPHPHRRPSLAAGLAAAASTLLLLLVVAAAPAALAQPQAPAQAGPGSLASSGPESRIAKNWRARIVFKSGVTQDLLWVGVSTDAFQNLRAAFWRHLNNEGPNRYTAAGPDGLQIAIAWTDVSAVTTWSD
jgi:hypothetical protein